MLSEGQPWLGRNQKKTSPAIQITLIFPFWHAVYVDRLLKSLENTNKAKAQKPGGEGKPGPCVLSEAKAT
jgi:hypothetical protein